MFWAFWWNLPLRLRQISRFLINGVVGRVDHSSGSSGCSILHIPSTNGQVFLSSDDNIHFKYPDFVTSWPGDAIITLCFTKKKSAAVCEQSLFIEEATYRLKVTFFCLRFWQKTQLLKGENGFYQPVLFSLQVSDFTANSPSLNSGWFLCLPCSNMRYSKDDSLISFLEEAPVLENTFI